jgi:predicted nucleic acid-binding Zn ribbon protein
VTNGNAPMDRPARLGAVLEQALKGSHIAIDFDLPVIWAKWAELVGPPIAQHTRPEAIRGDLLLVNVSSAPWMQELQYLKDEIIKKLNDVLGKKTLKEIYFQIGPVIPRRDMTASTAPHGKFSSRNHR